MSKVAKGLTEADKVVKRRDALDINDLYKAYMKVYEADGHIGDLAEELGRPLGSVRQRIVVLRKQVNSAGKQLPALKRQPGGGGGREASVIDPSLLGNLAALD